MFYKNYFLSLTYYKYLKSIRVIFIFKAHHDIIMKKTIVITALGLLLQIIRYFKNRASRIKQNSLLNIVKQLVVLTPTELIRHFDKLEDYGVCIGKAFASEKCYSMLQPIKPVIISKLYQIKNYNIKQELFNLKKLIRVKIPAFITLKDSFSSIPVLQTINLPTKTTHSMYKYNNVDKSSQINFIIYLINSFKNISIPYMSQSHFQEKYLPEGMTIAVLGKYKREASGAISCEKPIAMGFNHAQIIEKMQFKLSQLKIEKYLLVFGMAFCVGFILKELHKLYIDQRKKKLDPFENYQNLFVKSRVCFHCRQKLSNFILENCGHMSMCVQCKDKVKICGQCKKQGNSGIQLYAC